ncbi:hypothetical protein VNO77_23291 [Canavalia gladiata]|uniref:Uncharacterized protein n=1 Tax=Canavalia gladiata TaxID=3824 RepID=A0AAN9L464_CANGL
MFFRQHHIWGIFFMVLALCGLANITPSAKPSYEIWLEPLNQKNVSTRVIMKWFGTLSENLIRIGMDESPSEAVIMILVGKEPAIKLHRWMPLLQKKGFPSHHYLDVEPIHANRIG